MTPLAKPLDRRDWALLWLLSLLWGGAFFFAGVAVKELPPLTCVLVRVALATMTLLPIFLSLGFAVPRSLADWLPFFGMALLNNVLPFAFIFAGQTLITVGLSSIINAMTPLITVIVMAAFQRERLTLQRSVGVALRSCMGLTAPLTGRKCSAWAFASPAHRATGLRRCGAVAISPAFRL